MITPAPTTKIDPKLARGVLEEAGTQMAGKPEHVVLSFPNTSYRVHLRPTEPIRTEVGKRIVGVVQADVRRIDVVGTGGRFVEPVYGRPRRVQGTVVGIEGDRLVVNAGFPIHCKPTDSRQKASDFQPGQMVSFDVMAGATFTPKD